MDVLNRCHKDQLRDNQPDQPFIIPVIPHDIVEQNDPTPEVIFFHPKTLASAALAAGFITFLIELIRAANVDIDNDLRMHNPHAEYYAIVAAGVAELAFIKLSRHKYSFFSVANKLIKNAMQDIRLTMFEEDPEYHLANAIL